MGSCSGSRGGGNKLNLSSHLNNDEKILLYGIPESERGDFYYRYGQSEKALASVDKQWAEAGAVNQKQLENLKNYAKYEAIVVNEKLPTLTGSEKQKAWAEDIRRKKITDAIDTISKSVSTNDRPALLKEFKQRGIKAETFSDCVNYALNQKSEIKFLKTTTSAKEIIDKRDFLKIY